MNGVNYERVAEIAEKLIQRGENPTILRIRHGLGDTGSNTTISKYLNEWKSYKIVNTTRASSLEGPPLSEPINEAIAQIWQQLKGENEKEIEKIKNNTQLMLEDVELKLEESIKERDKVYAENQILRKKLEEFEKVSQNLNNELIQMKQQYEIFIGRMNEALTHHQEFKEEKEKQIAHLRSINEDLQKSQGLFTEQFIEKEKVISMLQSSVEENKHLSLERQKERQQLEGILRQDRLIIGKLKERIRQFEIELENLNVSVT